MYQFFKAFFNAIVSVFTSLFGYLFSFLRAIFNGIKALFGYIYDGIAALLTGLVNFFSEVIRAISAFGHWLFEKLIDFFGWFVDLFQWLIASLWNYAVDFFDYVLHWLVDCLYYFFYELLPDVDLSAYNSTIVEFTEKVVVWDRIFPVVTLFSAFVLLFLTFLSIAVIRLIIKAIPGIG